jgi:hypothetical protein
MKTLEQVFGKVKQPKTTPLPPFQLPDQSRTLIIFRPVSSDKNHHFKGQATYWQRNHRWELIGVTRSVSKWLFDIPYSQIERELNDRNLPFQWRQSPPFLSSKPEVPRSVH